MKIVQLGAISTGTVIILGIAMVLPAFIHTPQPLAVLLSFSIVDDNNVPEWCNELSAVFKKHNVKAVVFVTGIIAAQSPECVSGYPDNVDVGSQTYDYVDLASIHDYTVQLNEVQSGKRAVDAAGKIDSRLFRAPHGSTDENIYSLLSRSGILGDFSYDGRYNKYYNGQFIKFDINSYEGLENHADFYHSLSQVDGPVVINFDNHISIKQIDQFVSHLKSSNIRFVSASELTGIDLTVRKGELTLQ